MFHQSSDHETKPIYTQISNVKSRYQEIGLIDQGGIKSIKKVFDKVTSKYLALAELKAVREEKYYESFLKEARVTALLEHPNIMSIHDIGVKEDGSPFFTMDLKEGDSLRSIFKKISQDEVSYVKNYPLHERLIIFMKICDAVNYAHSKNVIHLDLKPENIQVGNYGEVLVCDWGSAQVKPESPLNCKEILLNLDLLLDHTKDKIVSGTPGYMAPEQTSPDLPNDKKSDIYSLGCILYSIISLSPPGINLHFLEQMHLV